MRQQLAPLLFTDEAPQPGVTPVAAPYVPKRPSISRASGGLMRDFQSAVLKIYCFNSMVCAWLRWIWVRAVRYRSRPSRRPCRPRSLIYWVVKFIRLQARYNQSDKRALSSKCRFKNWLKPPFIGNNTLFLVQEVRYNQLSYFVSQWLIH